MPLLSARQVALRQLKVVVEVRKETAAFRHLVDEEDCSEDGLDVLHAAAYERVLGPRYFDRPPSYRRREERWKRLLYAAVF